MKLASQRTTRLTRNRVALVVRSDKFVRVPSGYKPKEKEVKGDDWFAKTRRAARGVSDPKYDELFAERRRKVQKYVDREDLYTEMWDGDKYIGNRWNVLTVLAAIFVMTPVAGLLFAYFSYGKLWG